MLKDLTQEYSRNCIKNNDDNQKTIVIIVLHYIILKADSKLLYRLVIRFFIKTKFLLTRTPRLRFILFHNNLVNMVLEILCREKIAQ